MARAMATEIRGNGIECIRMKESQRLIRVFLKIADDGNCALLLESVGLGGGHMCHAHHLQKDKPVIARHIVSDPWWIWSIYPVRGKRSPIDINMKVGVFKMRLCSHPQRGGRCRKTLVHRIRMARQIEEGGSAWLSVSSSTVTSFPYTGIT